jgi:hypothetical protein
MEGDGVKELGRGQTSQSFEVCGEEIGTDSSAKGDQ